MGRRITSHALLLAGVWARSEDFDPGCVLPFDAIKEEHPIDADCGMEGEASKASHKLQNRAKNNFCASGTPALVTFTTFGKLQARVTEEQIPFGSSNSLPADRTALQGIYTTSNGEVIGEGSLVRVAAYILDAKFSNVKKGESVNCKRKGVEQNDVHLTLVKSKAEDDPCNGITAEIGPHFRPEAWLPEYLDTLWKRPVRLTGQLFFDASHVPCRPGKRASPARFSVWEVHPVHAIDVCTATSLPSCDPKDDSRWVPLHEWLGLEEHDDED